MGDFTAGEVFTDNPPGNAVNAARLNNHVNGATIAPTAISGKTDIGTAAVGGDFLLIFQASSSTLLKVSAGNLFVASSLIYVGATAPPASYQDTAHAWIKTNPSNPSRAGLRLWDTGTSTWRRAYNVPVGSIVAINSTSNFDSTGLGSGDTDGWALCNGNHGTINLTGTTTPQITSAAGATVVVNTAFSYTLTANNSPSSYSATNLPSGLTINTSTGVISGTPTGTGTYAIGLSAVNSSGNGTGTLTLTVVSSSTSVPVITSAAGGYCASGAAFSYQIAGTNAPSSFFASGLPSGLSVTSGGVISGTTGASGIYTLTISATNGTGTGNGTLTLLVSSALNYMQFIGYSAGV